MSSNTSVTLKPTAGFCIKSTTLQPAVYTPSSPSQQNLGPNSLEPASVPVPIPQGHKIFVNICWDPNVPPPPEGSEDVIQRAMKGEELDEHNSDGWFVPVVVSEARQETDKAGKPSLVFDCVYNKSIKSRTLKDPEFKVFIIELALQRIEAQTQLVLSRNIATPNISSKGKLQPRTVSIPAFLAPQKTSDSGPVLLSTPAEPQPRLQQKRPLIQEVEEPSIPSAGASKPKSILKSTTHPPVPSSSSSSPPPDRHGALRWSWSQGKDRLHIKISVPSLSEYLISQSSLDIEPRRLLLTIPKDPDSPPLTLDLDLNISDAELAMRKGGGMDVSDLSENNTLLSLKRQRPFDVEGATAEWRMRENNLIVSV
ncbi:hypothetical protein K435DRAFT_662077 [Dendrothele bispora CBS 962.96]|uniref:PIH1 N-terminal domain-containing protein n=1 Tax=Dendrothele bispora (strain CBS 962.96) TaxID=1314807 RepID=A0A4S8M6G9_DENBC|nr:hypothetical protein K435DRAFT_662077 [Dendrothele bispora CBS 962.96]